MGKQVDNLVDAVETLSLHPRASPGEQQQVQVDADDRLPLQFVFTDEQGGEFVIMEPHPVLENSETGEQLQQQANAVDQAEVPLIYPFVHDNEWTGEQQHEQVRTDRLLPELAWMDEYDAANVVTSPYFVFDNVYDSLETGEQQQGQTNPDDQGEVPLINNDEEMDEVAAMGLTPVFHDVEMGEIEAMDFGGVDVNSLPPVYVDEFGQNLDPVGPTFVCGTDTTSDNPLLNETPASPNAVSTKELLDSLFMQEDLNLDILQCFDSEPVTLNLEMESLKWFAKEWIRATLCDALVEEWRSLPSHERKTKICALAFAVENLNLHPWGPLKEWLRIVREAEAWGGYHKRILADLKEASGLKRLEMATELGKRIVARGFKWAGNEKKLVLVKVDIVRMVMIRGYVVKTPSLLDK